MSELSTTNDSFTTIVEPHLIVTLKQAFALNRLEELGSEPKLYVKFFLGGNLRFARAESQAVWNSTTVIEGDLNRPLYIMLFDEDDFGTDVLLSAAVLPSAFTRSCVNIGKVINIRLHDIGEFSENEIYEVDPEVLEPNNYDEDSSSCPDPILQLKVQCVDEHILSRLAVEFGSHSTVRGKIGNHTLYNVLVKRCDGAVWGVSLRFSQLWELRSHLLKLYPELAELPFPKRTILGSVWSSENYNSQLNESRIQQRKNCLEEFLNFLLGVDMYRSDPSLLSLLDRPVVKRISILEC